MSGVKLEQETSIRGEETEERRSDERAVEENIGRKEEERRTRRGYVGGITWG